MRKFFKTIISHLRAYHYRLRNSAIRQMARSYGYCLDEYNTNETTRQICLFGMVLLMIMTFILIA